MVTPIRREGRFFIILALLLATILSVTSFFYMAQGVKILALLSWVVFILVINFFRDPERQIPEESGVIVSPADGKVIDLQRVREEYYFHEEVIRVSIFMSLFDIHVNRAPIGGIINYLHYRQGNYLPACGEKASLDNEQMSIGIREVEKGENRREVKIMVKLIAGYIARRIVFWKKLHDPVFQGERIGMIKFGSRVEVYIPEEFEVTITVGEKVKAGVSIIARGKRTVTS